MIHSPLQAWIERCQLSPEVFGNGASGSDDCLDADLTTQSDAERLGGDHHARGVRTALTSSRGEA
jgi:hypothetical protein